MADAVVIPWSDLQKARWERALFEVIQDFDGRELDAEMFRRVIDVAVGGMLRWEAKNLRPEERESETVLRAILGRVIEASAREHGITLLEEVRS